MRRGGGAKLHVLICLYLYIYSTVILAKYRPHVQDHIFLWYTHSSERKVAFHLFTTC